MRRIFYLIFVLSIFYILIACGGGDKTASKMFDAEEALDDGNYDKVIEIIGTPETEDEKLILAEAYLGKSGVDVTNLIENSESVDDAFDVISSTLGLPVIDNETLRTKRENVKKALEILSDNESTDDMKMLGGISAAIDTVLLVGQVIIDVFNFDNITLSKEWFDNNSNYIKNNRRAIEKYLDNDNKTVVDEIKDNLKLVDNSIDVLGDNFQDLRDDFNDFVVDVCDGGIDNCSSQNITNYIVDKLPSN